MPSSMTKKRTPQWDRKPCGCVKTKLPTLGKVVIRCDRHRGKRDKKGRVVCYWDADGLVRRETA